MSHRWVELADVCRIEKGSIDPQKFPDRLFAHYSIPAFDAGAGPSIELGSAIKSTKLRIRSGAVLVSKLNPRIPRVWVVEDDGPIEQICSTEFVPFRPNESAVQREYLYWALHWLLSGGAIRGSTSAATKSRERAKPSGIARLKIPVPPIEEQRRIIDVLSRADGIKRLRREASAKAAELIPAIFHEMFGDPATNPKKWSVVSLGEVLSEAPTLGTMSRPSQTEGRWLDLRVANIQGGELQLTDQRWLDLPETQVDRFALRDGDIVLARAIGSREHLGKAIVVHPTRDWTFDSHLMRIRVDRTRLLPEVLKAFLDSYGGREEFLKHTRRSAIQFNINGKELRLIRMPLPPIALQKEFLKQVEGARAIQVGQGAATTTARAVFDSLIARSFQ